MSHTRGIEGNSMVDIRVVTREQIDELTKSTDKRVSLGGIDDKEKAVEARLNDLLIRLKGVATDFYVLTWNGNKVPRGDEIDGNIIGWTQNGVVDSTEGKMIGLYTRIVEFGGEDQKLQQMVIYTRRK